MDEQNWQENDMINIFIKYSYQYDIVLFIHFKHLQINESFRQRYGCEL